MILAKCYYINYYVADFSADGKSTHHEDIYQDHNNALLVAKELVKCLDVVDDVYVIDGLTGEILNTVPKAAPNENRAEEDSIPTFIDTFEDKNGGTWQLMEDGKWDYDCLELCCSDCIYCNSDNGGLCDVVEPLSEEDRNYKIELANKRIHAKTNENNTVDNEPFEDGFGGIWYKDEDNELWTYDCGGISCYGCPYNIDRWDCHTSNLSLDDAKKCIAEAKERIGK